MPLLQRLGIQLYGRQLPPGCGVVYGDGAALMDVPLDRLGIDYFVLGGRAPGERQIGSISSVPALAGAFCVGAVGQGIVTWLDPWCFGPAHVARIGANLDRLARGRWRLLLDFSDPVYAVTPPTPAELPHRAIEMIDAVRGHWRGAVDRPGRYYRTQGRIVGPRPEFELPAILLKLPANVTGCDQELSDRIDGILVAAPCPLARAGVALLLECPVVVRETKAAAEAAATGLALPAAGRPVAGTAAEVADELAARSAAVGADELIVSFPAICEAEIRIFAEAVIPRLRSAVAVHAAGAEA